MSSSYATVNNPTGNLDARSRARAEAIENGHGRIRAYYRAVAQDFRAWSERLNMHFGYWAWGVNPFNREAMLERMNLEVLDALKLPAAVPARLADLGCGAGATARAIVQHRPYTSVDAVTLVMEQILQGAELNRAAKVGHALRFHLSDYANTALPGAQYDGVYALESSCHARGAGKRFLVKEMHRLLKPGGAVVIVDALLRKRAPLPASIDRLYRGWCRNWAVSELGEQSALRDALEREGFVDVKFRDIGWRIAPSALQIPLFATRFALRELWRARGRLNPWRKGHILASYASFLMGCWWPGFGYYVVTARKPA
ncbi:MAG: methyltransferase domain-containing protein [Burkholderiales bacterium]